MKAVPGGGYDDSRVRNRVSSLPSFYIAKYETTISMYADYLNEKRRRRYRLGRQDV